MNKPKYSFSYDGKGINDKNSEYCPRILTFERTAPFSDVELDKLGALIAAAPEMLAELERIQTELLEHDNADAELASRLYRVINKAKGINND